MQTIDDTNIRNYQEIVWDYYHSNARTGLPWRQPETDGLFDPYKIMLSEIMLQQTQVQRVMPKYHAFLERFPTLADLATAELGDVLRMWAGLGYNRRAKFLHQAAQSIQTEHSGVFPHSVAELVGLPGVGVNTAGAIRNYAFNEPQPFIETNIRTVLIHHFCDDQQAVPEKELLTLATQTLDAEHPREWHWALMDYGSFLKQQVGNASRQSKIYTKQSAFAGSNRQLRGQVIRSLNTGTHTLESLQQQIDDERLSAVLKALVSEGLVVKNKDSYQL